MARGESTQRSQLDADHLTQVLREQGTANLRQAEALTLILDHSEVRRADSQAQQHLMQVKALDGRLVNGYRTINVLGLGDEDARGLLYHRLFSSQQAAFRSENVEVQQAIRQTEASLSDYGGTNTWVMDCGFDNDDVWWTIWDYPGSHVVCRLYHHERIVLWQTAAGVWEERYLDATYRHLQPLAEIETELEVRLVGQRRPKRQPVRVQLSALALRIYHPSDKTVSRAVWLVKVQVVNALGDPWYLLTDWPVTDRQQVVDSFITYRQRWSVEDTFKFVKTCFGLETVQMLDFQAIRTLVACAWVAAGFLFALGLTLNHEEVRLLARLGGWDERPNRPPGKLILTRGLRRLLDLLATQAILLDYLATEQVLPPFIHHLLAARGLSS